MLSLQLIREHPDYDTTGRYTVNYRVAQTPQSVLPEFFVQGNAEMRRRHPDGFPWNRNAATLRREAAT